MGERSTRHVTLQDVALAAGVSTGTASQALNNNPLVRAATRARVLAAAQRLDYIPDRNASRLLRGHTECIGVAFNMDTYYISGDTFYALVVRGITKVLEEHSYTVRFMRLDESLTSSAHPSKRPLSGRDIDGLLVLNSVESALLERLRALDVPLVVIDASGSVPDLPSVDNDDRGGVAMGVRYLLELGHRQIALLNLPLDQPFAREALAGYLQAFEEHGLEVAPWLLRSCLFGIAYGRQAMAELLAQSRPPSAVFAVGDEIAVGAMQAIQEVGLRIPEDISVVGMDDIPLAAEVRPALTTVRVDMEALGQQATRALLHIIAGHALDRRHSVLPTHLVVRNSAAPAG